MTFQALARGPNTAHSVIIFGPRGNAKTSAGVEPLVLYYTCAANTTDFRMLRLSPAVLLIIYSRKLQIKRRYLIFYIKSHFYEFFLL